MSIDVIAAVSTDLFVGSPEAPQQVLRVRVSRTAAPPARLLVAGAAEGEAEVPPGDGELELEVGLRIPHDVLPGTQLQVTVTVGESTLDAMVTVEQTGYTLHLVSHFHYDPVWWNTQAAYTSPWAWLSGDATTRPMWECNAFALVDAHLDLALRDPDYRFVLAEIDYLKPYFDIHPQRRADLHRLLDEGRVELLGGTYNEPNTNLTGLETTVRNIVYGVGYQRDILGGDPATAWQLDAFGHDPQFPGLLAAAGLTGSAWARGPYHQWGPMLRTDRHPKGDATVMQFPSEFEWIAPSGQGVLTHYMPNHYHTGWWMDSAPSLSEAELAVYALYRALKPVAATRHILLPVGTDYSPPNKWVTEIHRSWNKKYVWPRFRCAIPRDFFDAVRAELATQRRRPSPQTRDMNPIYTGKDVSYIDTKQAQRAGEVAVTDAEKLATVAALLGLGAYPDAALDKAWRLLAYGAHHDAITGTESDQVYIDLLGGWREAHDLAADARGTALAALMSEVDTTGEGTAVVVTNTLSFDRSDLVRVPGCPPGRLIDDTGTDVPAVYDRGTLAFRADRVPALGWRTWRLLPGDPAPAWSPAPGATIGNQRYRVVADPTRGGTFSSIVDKSTGRELLRGAGNELRVYEEYSAHPEWGEGPWHLLPRGPVVGSAAAPAIVRREVSPAGERFVVTGMVAGIRYEQTTTLWHGLDRVDFATRVVDHAAADQLLRVRFPVDLPGALPVCEVAAAVVGRGFALPDVDAAQAPWTLDNPANTWFGLGCTARVSLASPAGAPLGDRAIGVAEVVVPDSGRAADARDLVVALARVGVTATTSGADSPRYGYLDIDSNLPDVRILLGGPHDHPLTRELLRRAGPTYQRELDRQLAATGQAMLWVPAEQPLSQVWHPNADLRDVRALPALIVTGDGAAAAADVADARIEAIGLAPPHEPLTDGIVGLLTYGLPGFAVDPTGALHLSLMRSCTGWPSGVWIDPPRRTAPDGSGFQLQHWTHEFHYALVSGDGDWRELALPSRGQEFTTPLLPRHEPSHSGSLPATHSFLRVDPARQVLLSTLKPAGNPIATGRAAPADPTRGVTLRLVETSGLGTQAVVDGALTLTATRQADLLERPGEPTGWPLALAGSEVATLHATPSPAAAPAAAVAQPGRTLGATVEPAQPVYARYWLHNRGPAPIGYLPVTVAVTPSLLPTTGLQVEFEVVLASQLQDTDHEGVARLRAPAGWHIEPVERVYRLAPNGQVRFTATVTPPAGTVNGLYFVAAQIEYGGQVIEDVTTVTVGHVPDLLPVPGPVPPEAEAVAGTTASTARATGLRVNLLEPQITLPPGGRGALGIMLTNDTSDAIHGEIQLISPWGTWDLLPSVLQGFAVQARARSIVRFPVTVPADASPGHSWALAKVMWYGRCQYAPSARLMVT